MGVVDYLARFYFEQQALKEVIGSWQALQQPPPNAGTCVPVAQQPVALVPQQPQTDPAAARLSSLTVVEGGGCTTPTCAC